MELYEVLRPMRIASERMRSVWSAREMEGRENWHNGCPIITLLDLDICS